MSRNKNSKPQAWAHALRRAWRALKHPGPKRPAVPPATQGRGPLSSRMCELAFCFLIDEVRGWVVGDLTEEYRLIKIKSGRIKAAFWLCRQIPASQRQLRRSHPVLKGVCARLRPVAVKVRTWVQFHPVARRYRALASHAAVSLLTFLLLAAFNFHRWVPEVGRLRVDSSREQMREAVSPPTTPEPAPRLVPTPSRVAPTREISAPSRRPTKKVPPRETNSDYVVEVSFIARTLLRGPSQSGNSKRLVIPAHSMLVNLSLILPDGSRHGRYTVKLSRLGGATFYSALPYSQNGKSITVSVPAIMFSEGTYRLVVSEEDDSLVYLTNFEVAKPCSHRCGDKGKTPPVDEPAPPPSPLEPV